MFTKFAFILKSDQEGVLELKFPLLQRSLFIGIALLLSTTILMNLGNPLRQYTLPGVFLLISLFAALYDESWVFNSAGAIHKHGIIFLHRRTEIPSSDIEAVRLSSFTKGTQDQQILQNKPFYMKTFFVLSLELSDGRIRDIEMVVERQQSRIEEKGKRIAEQIQKQLRIIG